MGVLYYGVCLDCKQYIDLDKFPGFACILDPSVWDEWHIDFVTNRKYVFTSLRLQHFMRKHKGHRFGVYDEYQFTSVPAQLGWPDPIDRSEYEEVYPWPNSTLKDKENEEIE